MRRNSQHTKYTRTYAKYVKIWLEMRKNSQKIRINHYTLQASFRARHARVSICCLLSLRNFRISFCFHCFFCFVVFAQPLWFLNCLLIFTFSAHSSRIFCAFRVLSRSLCFANLRVCSAFSRIFCIFIRMFYAFLRGRIVYFLSGKHPKVPAGKTTTIFFL